MELDDLRRQWRLPEPVAPPALTSRDLNALLKGRTSSLIEKMRRNAWLEIGLTLVMNLGPLVALALMRKPLYPHYLFSVLMLVIVVVVLVMLAYYYRLLGVLKRMLEPATSIQLHLTTLAQGLRQLLRFYYLLTLWMGPMVVALMLGYYTGAELARPGPMRWGFLAGFAIGMLVSGIPMQLGIVYVTRWYLQRLYGRHLDRLEGQLRELSEDEPLGA